MIRAGAQKFSARAFVAILLAAGVTLYAASAPAGQAPARGSGRSGNAAAGQKVFLKDGCYQCHGRHAQGSPATAPRLGPDPLPYEAFVRAIRQPRNEMPPYTEKVLSNAELADIYAFVQSRPKPPAGVRIP